MLCQPLPRLTGQGATALPRSQGLQHRGPGLAMTPRHRESRLRLRGTATAAVGGVRKRLQRVGILRCVSESGQNQLQRRLARHYWTGRARQGSCQGLESVRIPLFS